MILTAFIDSNGKTFLDADYDWTQTKVHYKMEAGTTPSTGYTDKTTIENVGKYGEEITRASPIAAWRDKKNVRDLIKTLVYTKMGVAVAADTENDTKYALLTTAEQSVALHWFVLGKESWQLAVVNDDKYWTENAASYRVWTTEQVRRTRLRRMESLIFRRLLYLEQAKDILLTMTQVLEGTPIPLDASSPAKTTSPVRVRTLTSTFVEGVEGTLEDNAGSFVFESLFDYIDSRTGTAFAGKGFRNVTHTFRGTHTAATVANELLDIGKGNW